jgi:hypothetical protein
MPWQSKDRCTSKLMYATSKGPKAVRAEIERLGAILDATRAYRAAIIAENRAVNKRCSRPGVKFGECMYNSRFTSKYSNVKLSDIEFKESEAWLNLYYFASEYKQYVQPAKYSLILRWGVAIEKCHPRCKYND